MLITDWINLVAAIVVSVVDIALIVWLKQPTISKRVRYYAKEMSFSAFSWGVLGGHFFGPHVGPMFGSWPVSIGILVSVGLLLGLLHWFVLRKRELIDGFSLVYLAIGIACGALFWSQ